MVATRGVVKFFLASPNDLVDERRAAKHVFDDFNDSWAEHLGFSAELVSWEDTVSGPGRPQETINRDLDKCDYFIGMVWRRWGSPPDNTGAFSSGFHEEYTRSIESYKKSRRPGISLYFKDIPKDALADPGDQLKRVLDFKQQVVEKKEVMYESFSSIEDFKKILNKLLIRKMQELVNSIQRSYDSREASPEISGSEQQSDGEDSVLTKEGGAFLADLLSKVRSDKPITSLDISRLRVLGFSISDHGNGPVYVDVHDGNIIFATASSDVIGFKEQVALLVGSLAKVAHEVLPLWRWAYTTNVYRNKQFYTFTSPSYDDEVRVGAFRIMEVVKEGLPEGNRNELIALWMEDENISIRTAALRYLAVCGIDTDIPLIEKTSDRREGQLDDVVFKTIVRIEERFSVSKAIARVEATSSYNQIDESKYFIMNNRERFGDDAIIRLVENHRGPFRDEAMRIALERNVIGADMLQRLLSDDRAIIRFMAIRGLENLNGLMDEQRAIEILRQPAGSQGGSLLGFGALFGRENSHELAMEYRYQRYLNGGFSELIKDANDNTVFDYIKRFAIMTYKNQIDELRSVIDNGFSALFDQLVAKMRSETAYPNDFIGETLGLKDSIVEEYAKAASRAICAIGQASDMQRVRLLVKSHFWPVEAIRYFRLFGSWEDIPELLENFARSQNRQYLPREYGEHVTPTQIALLVLHIAGEKSFDLFSLPIKAVYLSEIIKKVNKETIFSIGIDKTISLLSHESADIRKIAALRIVRDMKKKEIAAIMEKYQSLEQRFYNVIFWLDLGVSFPLRHCRDIARRELLRL